MKSGQSILLSTTVGIVVNDELCTRLCCVHIRQTRHTSKVTFMLQVCNSIFISVCVHPQRGVWSSCDRLNKFLLLFSCNLWSLPLMPGLKRFVAKKVDAESI